MLESGNLSMVGGNEMGLRAEKACQVLITHNYRRLAFPASTASDAQRIGSNRQSSSSSSC